MMPPTPNALHWLPALLSASRFHDAATFRPSALTGMLATSAVMSPPRPPGDGAGGVTMRQRQSSVTIDTQVPVRSIGASARAGCGGPPPRPPPPRWAEAPDSPINMTAHMTARDGATHHHDVGAPLVAL